MLEESCCYHVLCLLRWDLTNLKLEQCKKEGEENKIDNCATGSWVPLLKVVEKALSTNVVCHCFGVTYGCKQVHARALQHGSCFLQRPADRRELLQKFPMALFAFSCTTEGWVLVLIFLLEKQTWLLHVWVNWSANMFCLRFPNSVRKLNYVKWRSYKGQLFLYLYDVASHTCFSPLKLTLGTTDLSCVV